MTSWRYLAQDARTLDWVHNDLPLTDVEITRSLSAPGRLSGVVPVEDMSLVDPSGALILREWGTLIWAEADGVIRGGGILVQVDTEGPTLTLDVMGLSGYLADLPYIGVSKVWPLAGVRGPVDPLDLVRFMWAHAYEYGGAPPKFEIDATTSPVRLGTFEAPENVADEDRDKYPGPHSMTWWNTPDMGGEMDRLAAETPFDFLEHVEWEDREAGTLRHRLQLGYPSIGTRRDATVLRVGDNVSLVPVIERADFASEVYVLGAGEGAAMVRGHQIADDTGRLRRVAVISDKAADTPDRARHTARRELDVRAGKSTPRQLVVASEAVAQLGPLDLGDEVRLEGATGWGRFDQWVRVLGVTVKPEATWDAFMFDVMQVGVRLS